MTSETEVTALADGAKNCWSVISVLQRHCQKLECILDWFHIAKKLQNVSNALDEAFENSLDSVKWKLWHGQIDEALTKIELLKVNLTVEEKKSKLQGLYDYIKRNKQYIVNYEERTRNHQTYTSQVAESYIDSVINARHKKSGKMQWTRSGAHNVLQIRAMITSNEWQREWQKAVLSALGAVA